MWRKWLARIVKAGLAATALAVVTTVASVTWIRWGSDDHIFAESEVPAAPVALVLGAQVYEDGVPSPFLVARLEIAQRLLAAGKVQAILVSGDHREFRYDEPGAMQRWLVEHGVPERKVVQDHAGFDTYDSCVRATKIFGVTRTIVVTQTYHLARAVKLCRAQGIETDGVGDDTVRRFTTPWRISSTREYGACVKAAVDVASGRDPVFLGPHESGVEQAVAA